MRIVRSVSRTTALLLMLTGSVVGMYTGASSAQVPTGKTSNSSLSPQRICLGSFRSAVLLDWAPATIAVFRNYQYGGPKSHRPFAHVFSTLPGNTHGAWCGTKVRPNDTHWWAVVVGQKPATLGISGPDGVRHGLVSGPPRTGLLPMLLVGQPH